MSKQPRPGKRKFGGRSKGFNNRPKRNSIKKGHSNQGYRK